MISIRRWLRYKPGQRVPQSGQYTTSDGYQVTCVRGERFPPSPRPHQTYRLTDKTR